MMKWATMAAAAALMLSGQAQAAVTDRSAAGFQSVNTATIAAAPDQVYRALRNVPAWWDGAHSWSGSARNLELDLRQGCLCERLPEGYVRHMEVIYSDETSTIRLAGALGPLATTGATGHLAITLKAATPTAAGTDVSLTYDVGGYARGGLEKTFADPVDKVLAHQLARLKRFVETGRPDPSIDPINLNR